MINKDKTHRLMIQVSKKQYTWLKNKANQLDISISQLIRWLLNKKIKDYTDIQKFDKNPKEEIDNSDVSFEELIKELEETEKKPESSDFF